MLADAGLPSVRAIDADDPMHETGDVEVLHATDEHPFHVVETGAWTRADRLRVGDGLSTISGVAELVGISFGRETVPVYNLSIPATPTYYVGDHGVWVHNCGLDLDLALQATRVMDRNGLTKGGRALQKHASRSGSRWSTSATRAQDINAEADFLIMEVLTDPGSVQRLTPNGNHLEVIAPDGRRLRFLADGTFSGFGN